MLTDVGRGPWLTVTVAQKRRVPIKEVSPTETSVLFRPRSDVDDVGQGLPERPVNVTVGDSP